jgi:hypothetical protein
LAAGAVKSGKNIYIKTLSPIDPKKQAAKICGFAGTGRRSGSADQAVNKTI